jgi:hypothetical protein
MANVYVYINAEKRGGENFTLGGALKFRAPGRGLSPSAGATLLRERMAFLIITSAFNYRFSEAAAIRARSQV